MTDLATATNTREDSATSLYDIVGEFNAIFHGDASATVQGGRLLITIGGRTMEIQLPQVVGAEGAGTESTGLSC